MSDYLIAAFGDEWVDQYVTGLVVGPRHKVLDLISAAKQTVWPVYWHMGDNKYLTYANAEDYKDHWITMGISGGSAVELMVVFGKMDDFVTSFGVFPTPDTFITELIPGDYHEV